MKNKMIAAMAVAGLAAAAGAGAEPPEGRERFSAFAVSLEGGNGPAAGVVQITVDRWSSPEERRRLESVLEESGPDALIDLVRKAKPVGRIRTANSLGYDLRFAYQTPLASGGRRIVIGTDRPLSFYEASRRPRSTDYPFTILEMRVDEQGRGQGQLVVAGRVTAIGDTIDVENYAATPVRLTQVRLEK
jgi:hypothetical protein